MTDVLNFPVALETIRSNDKYREEFTQIAQDIRADIISFKDNPNCGCRRKINEFIDKNKETEPLKAFLESWKPRIEKLYLTAEEYASQKAAQDAQMADRRKAIASQPTPLVGPDGKPLPPNNMVPPKNMTGHVVEIPATPGEYKTLIEHAQKERWMYRGLSLKDGKAADGSAIWLVFFF